MSKIPLIVGSVFGVVATRCMLVVATLLASLALDTSASGQLYDAAPTPYCTVSYQSASAYNSLQARVTGTSPAARDLIGYVLEAFALANYNNTALDAATQANVTTALQRLGEMWDPARLCFKTNYLDAGVFDGNQVQFVAETIVHIPYRFPRLLAQYGPVETPGTIEYMLADLLARSKQGALSRKPPISYTNMWLMLCANPILLGQGLADGNGNVLLPADPTAVNFGRTNLIKWVNCIRANGVHEFMSPTYTAVDLAVLGDLILFAKDPSIVAMAQQCYRLLWIDLYANWYNRNERMGGTHSRTYSFLKDQGEMDLFFYAASNPATQPSPAWPQLISTRSIANYRRGQDYICYMVPPPSDVPLLFPLTVPVGTSRTVLRNFNNGSSPFMYAENYMANPAGTGGLSYPFSLGTQQYLYDDITSEGYTLAVPGDAKTVNVNFNMQSRKDYYLSLPNPGGKRATLMPFITSVQKGPEVLFMAASNGKTGSNSSFDAYTVEVASTIIFPSTTQVWIGNSAAPQTFTSGQSVPLGAGDTIFLRTSNAGQNDGLVTGIRFLASTDMYGNTIAPSLVYDGTAYGAMRVTWLHSGTVPVSGYGVLAYWSRTAYCSDTTTNFNAFRTAMTSAAVTAVQNYSTGECTFGVPGWSGSMGINANASAYTITSLYGGDIQAAPAPPLLTVNGTEYLSSTVQDWTSLDQNWTSLGQSWTSLDIGAATGGTGVPLTSGTLYNGQIQVTGGGGDIDGTSDGFQFYHQQITGTNVSITGRLTSMPTGSGIDAWAKAGLMMRNDLTPGSMNALVGLFGTYGQRFSTRTTTNGSSSRNGNGITALPYWFKIVRAGNLFTGYSSPDGLNWTQVGGATTIEMGNTIYVGMAVTSRNNSKPLSAIFDNLDISILYPSDGPMVATFPTPTLASGGTASNLSVTVADASRTSNLIYTWTTTGTSPAPVTFSPNGTASAANTTATFTKSGTYSFLITTTDTTTGFSFTSISSVSVTVDQIATSILINPSSTVLATGSTQQFTASVLDQFGNAMIAQPTLAWTLASGSGSVTASGLYSAPSSSGTAVIRASCGAAAANAGITVIANWTSLGQNWTSLDIGAATGGTGVPLTSGTLYNGQIQVTGGGVDIWGTSDSFQFYYQQITGTNVSIIGRLTSMPSGINDWAKAGLMMRNDLTPGSMNAMLCHTGSYGQRFSTRTTTNGSSARNGNGITTLPYWFKIVRAGNLFTGYSSPDGLNWTQVSTPATIAMGNTIYVGMAVTSRNNSKPLSAIFDNLGSDALMNPWLVTFPTSTMASGGTASNLSVTAADASGTSNLIYTWTTTGTSPAPVTFSPNGTASAANTTATFTKSGTYSFLVTITNPIGLSATSSVSVAVSQIPTSILITPSSAVLATGATQQFTASVLDQFGNAMIPQPAHAWTLASGSGSVTASGLYSAPSSGGTAAIQTSSGALAANAGITVTASGFSLAEQNAPRITPSASAGAFTISVTSSVIGHTYQLQSTSDLATGVWQNLGAAQAGTGEDLQFNVAGGDAQRCFYRVCIQRFP